MTVKALDVYHGVSRWRNSEECVPVHVGRTVLTWRRANTVKTHECNLSVSIQLPAFQAYCELRAGFHSLGYSADTSLNCLSLHPRSSYSVHKSNAFGMLCPSVDLFYVQTTEPTSITFGIGGKAKLSSFHFSSYPHSPWSTNRSLQQISQNSAHRALGTEHKIYISNFHV
jgi:hypothetical protein